MTNTTLTARETVLLTTLVNNSDNPDGASWVDMQDALKAGFTLETTRGLLGSLTKKDMIADMGNGFEGISDNLATTEEAAEWVAAQ